jgi:hypothetical protein
LGDDGDSEEGYGVQFVIVWDGGMLAYPQEVTNPKVPVTSVCVVQDQREDEDLAIVEELEIIEIVSDGD